MGTHVQPCQVLPATLPRRARGLESPEAKGLLRPVSETGVAPMLRKLGERITRDVHQKPDEKPCESALLHKHCGQNQEC